MSQRIIGVVKYGKFTEIHALGKKDIKGSSDTNDPTRRLVDITRRPDIKVGDPWPPPPQRKAGK